MPQNKDTWFQEKVIPLPSCVNNVVWKGRSANQSCKCDDDCDDSGVDDGQGVHDLLQDYMVVVTINTSAVLVASLNLWTNSCSPIYWF